jgi:hypothetical protein
VKELLLQAPATTAAAASFVGLYHSSGIDLLHLFRKGQNKSNNNTSPICESDDVMEDKFIEFLSSRQLEELHSNIIIKRTLMKTFSTNKADVGQVCTRLKTEKKFAPDMITLELFKVILVDGVDKFDDNISSCFPVVGEKLQQQLLEEACYYCFVCYKKKQMEKGSLLKVFTCLYEYDVVTKNVFIKWRDNIADTREGRREGIIESSQWLLDIEQQENE